jgi:hypothetical protein
MNRDVERQAFMYNNLEVVSIGDRCKIMLKNLLQGRHRHPDLVEAQVRGIGHS